MIPPPVTMQPTACPVTTPSAGFSFLTPPTSRLSWCISSSAKTGCWLKLSVIPTACRPSEREGERRPRRGRTRPPVAWTQHTTRRRVGTGGRWDGPIGNVVLLVTYPIRRVSGAETHGGRNSELAESRLAIAIIAVAISQSGKPNRRCDCLLEGVPLAGVVQRRRRMHRQQHAL